MCFDDYERVRTLLTHHGIHSPPFEDWRHRWVDNPVWRRLGGALPIGWVLETPVGAIVGSIESIPTRYTFRGSDLVAAASSAWCVNASYRGYALQLINEYFSQPVDLFMSTTVGQCGLKALSQFYGPMPLGRWDAVSSFITNTVPVAEQALRKHQIPFAPLLAYPAGWMLELRERLTWNRLPKASRSVPVEAIDKFDVRFDAFWDELLRENREKLLADRSSRTLSWHFDAAIRANRLWIFTASKMGRLRGYCVMRHESWLGGQAAILIDYQSLEPEPDLLPGFLRAALQRCAADAFFCLQNFGVGVPKMRAFDNYATYRGKLPGSIFFSGAVDPALQAELRRPECWDPSLFDGDATL